MPPNLHSRRHAFLAFWRAAFRNKFHAAFAPMLLVAFSLCNAAQSVTLAWDPNPEPDIAKYKVYYGTQSGNPDQSFDAGNVTTTTVVNLADGTTYFFTVRAINTAGLESGPSNEVSRHSAAASLPAFVGVLDEVAFWKGRALTLTEVQEIYNAGAGKAYSTW